jgi:DNA (cytosine-5)-methyltransferase 1
VHHRGGRTFNRIIEVLREELGYYVPEPQIINAKDFGVPQNRERVFIIGFRSKSSADGFEYPKPFVNKTVFRDVKEKSPVSVRYYISETYLKGLINHRERHQAKGNGFGFEIIADDSISNAILLGGMGRERNLVIDNRLHDFTPITNIQGQVNKEGIRRMTPREWARLQGFPNSFIIDAVSVTHSYRQIANAVAVPAIEETGKMLIRQLIKENGNA